MFLSPLDKRLVHTHTGKSLPSPTTRNKKNIQHMRSTSQKTPLPSTQDPDRLDTKVNTSFFPTPRSFQHPAPSNPPDPYLHFSHPILPFPYPLPYHPPGLPEPWDRVLILLLPPSAQNRPRGVSTPRRALRKPPAPSGVTLGFGRNGSLEGSLPTQAVFQDVAGAETAVPLLYSAASACLCPEGRSNDAGSFHPRQRSCPDQCKSTSAGVVD